MRRDGLAFAQRFSDAAVASSLTRVYREAAGRSG
jgi:hypothetical protein